MAAHGEEEASVSNMEEDTNTSSSFDVEVVVPGKRKRKERNLSLPMEEKRRVKWSRDEKSKLLSAVKEHGHTDVEKLAEIVTSKTAGQITHYLRSREAHAIQYIRSKTMNTNMKTPTDIWVEELNTIMTKEKVDFSSALGDAIRFIAEYEVKKPGESVSETEKNHADVFALYKYLEAVLNQEIVPVLSPSNEKILGYLIDLTWRVAGAVMPELKDEMKFLEDWSVKSVKKPNGTEPSTSGQSEDGKIPTCNASSIFSLNPVQIPDAILESACSKLQTNRKFTEEIETFAQMCMNGEFEET